MRIHSNLRPKFQAEWLQYIHPQLIPDGSKCRHFHGIEWEAYGFPIFPSISQIETDRHNVCSLSVLSVIRQSKLGRLELFIQCWLKFMIKRRVIAVSIVRQSLSSLDGNPSLLLMDVLTDRQTDRQPRPSRERACPTGVRSYNSQSVHAPVTDVSVWQLSSQTDRRTIMTWLPVCQCECDILNYRVPAGRFF